MTTTPAPKDTRHSILAKIVQAAWNNATAPATSLQPSPSDTRWRLMHKWNQIKAGG